VKIFLDANVLVTVLCNEYPQFAFCSKVLSLCDDNRFEVYTSPLCLAIAFYFARKKNGLAVARKKINLLAGKISAITMNEEAVNNTVANKSINDFEDGLEHYSAIQSKCKCIVTGDVKDFYFSEIEVLNPHDFLLKYVVKN
jgi:predicted nucleic acid-binding protein